MLDYESQHLLRQIAERDRSLAHYLKIINKRVDLVGKALAMQLAGDLSEPQEVTLSEGGMAFSSPQPYPIDSWLMLRMVLMPSPWDWYYPRGSSAARLSRKVMSRRVTGKSASPSTVSAMPSGSYWRDIFFKSRRRKFAPPKHQKGCRYEINSN